MTERPSTGRKEPPVVRTGGDRLLRAQKLLPIAYVVIAAIALVLPASRIKVGTVGFHFPFIVALSVACALATRAMWTRFRLDGTSRSFLLTAAFAGLALVFAPHSLAGLDLGSDVAYGLFDPAARTVFGFVVLAAMLNVPLPRLLRHPIAGLVLLAGILAAVADMAAHSAWVQTVFGDDPRRTVAAIEILGVLAHGGVVALAFRTWQKRRSRFAATLAQVSAVMVVAAVLNFVGPVWTLLWWWSHTGLLVTALVIVLGISQQVIRAIGAEELVLHYQPKVDLRTGGLCGVEALVRWNHPDRGLVLPGDFIPLIEMGGLNRPFAEWVLRRALQQHREWRGDGLLVPVAVNVSPRLLLDAGLAEMVGAQLKLSQVDPGMLHLELTETAFTGGFERVRRATAELRALGVRLSIDDYGTGHWSLASLRHLLVDEVKIDKSFVADIARSESTRIIVESTVKLSHDLGYDVVAEGVEDEECRALVTQLGADIGQGYLWARPLPPADLADWVRQRGVPVRGPIGS